MAKTTAIYTKAEAIEIIVKNIKDAQKHNVPDECILQVFKSKLFDPTMVNNHERQEVLVGVNEALGTNITMQQIRDADSLQLDAVLEANREREEELKAQQANNPNGDSKMKTDKVTAVKNMFGNENEGISMGLVVAAGALVGAGAAMFARESYDIASLAGGVAGVGVGYLAGNYLLNGDELTITNYCVGGAVGVGIGAVGALAGGMAGDMVKGVSPVAAVPVTVVSTEQ